MSAAATSPLASTSTTSVTAIDHDHAQPSSSSAVDASPPSPSSSTLAPLPPVEAAKRLAAYAAVDRHVGPDDRLIGIGSGTTVPFVVERIVQQGKLANKRRWFFPTGFQSKELIVKAGLRLAEVDQFPQLDVTLDGADEIDDDLNCIKGGGACHLREKVLAEAAKVFVLVADDRKMSSVLGTAWKQGVPIEVAMFAWATVQRSLERMGCTAATLRMAKAKAGPVVTDNGNFVIDATFDSAYMRDPSELLHRIKLVTGVLEVGLFCGMASAAYFGRSADESVLVRWPSGESQVLSAIDLGLSSTKFGDAAPAKAVGR